MTEIDKIIESIENSSTTTVMPKRHKNKWSVNETLDLEREYNLLKMSYEDIANKHERTVDSIILKLKEMQDEFEYDKAEALALDFKSETNKLFNDYSVKFEKLEKKGGLKIYDKKLDSITKEFIEKKAKLNDEYREYNDEINKLNKIYDNALEALKQKYNM
jgi:hypothetical protein